MKKKIGIVFITLLCSFLFTNVYAESNDSNEIISDKYQYSAIEGDNKQNINTFVYRDSDFTKSSYIGSKSLETLSIQVAAASISWYGEELDEYEIDSSNNDYNVNALLKKMKFNNIEVNKYYRSEKKENSMGAIIGQKTIIQDGKKYILLAVIPRSAGYKLEWAGNFTIGDGDIHEGFKSARDEVLRFTKEYIDKNNITGDLKIWTVGYSRGAAVSNLLGGFFAGGGVDYFGDNVSLTPEDVYCYTIGTPSSIKDGVSKNIELSVEGNRNSEDYVNDTKGSAYNYTKGGTVDIDSDIYNGIRSIISYDDAFPLLPPEAWGFSRYGKVIDSYDGLISEEEMLNELKSVSEYVYNAYTENGKRKEFSKKKFDLKSLSIVDVQSDTSQIEFFKERLKALTDKIETNQLYYDEYEEGIKSAIGTYGMAMVLINDDSESSMATSDMIYPLVYSYIAYISEELQNKGKASSETEAVTMVVEDLLTYFTGDEIDKDTFSIDDFVKLFAKYMSDNEEEPISDSVVNAIINLVPEEYQSLLSMFSAFSTKPNPEISDGLKAFIKACYYGPEEGSAAYNSYQDSDEVRKLFYITMLFSQGSTIPEINDLLMDDEGNVSGAAKFEEFVDLMLKVTKQEKDENGNVIKTYSDMGELADAKLVGLLDNALEEPINKSQDLYGEEYKEDFQKEVNTFKQNVTKVREALCPLFFGTEGGYNVGESLENAITLVDNASLIVLPHFDEIYLSLSRNSNRYEEDYYLIKGDNQEISNNEDLVLVYSFNHYEFIERGKVYIDDKELSKDKYSISKGSTVITINKEYLKGLKEGKHTIVAMLDNNSVDASFTISNKVNPDGKIDEIINPSTGDNIFVYISMLGLSIIGLLLAGLLIKKKEM